ncbi:contractile injection system tape measure protein [Paucibacter sp. KCTC 42545]|uniref:contractile injection system tape measure protein n=1 Tax=Paucibacter sp. KCTC 42545 TaxID=1768242 RepID=UPI000733B168|nr:contractile injection system tape measure protein [Paucibacter sp. KCTC 42545]ALT76851.1 hypothetical protein AT984_06250 [Paucibacter sp. KCTC 42545]
MRTSTHRIETLCWEADFASARSAWAEQDRLARFLKTDALAQISQAFDRCLGQHGQPGQVWRIDKLALDLGTLRLQDEESQWAQQLQQALDLALDRCRLAEPGQAGLSTLCAPAHELAQFLHFVQHGHAHWALSGQAARSLNDTVLHLVRSQGQQFWTALQALPEATAVQARLASIAPLSGLQALLAQRDPQLAHSLLLLDQHWLAPLHASGKLSRGQQRRLQQASRVAALQALWGSSGGGLKASRRRALLAALRQAQAKELGDSAPAGPTAAVAKLGQARQDSARITSSAPDSTLALQDQPLARYLLQGLQQGPGRDSAGQARPLAPDPSAAPPHTWDAALARLRLGLSRARSHPAEQARMRGLLMPLLRIRPQALRQALQSWAQQRQSRRQWSLALDAPTLWEVMALLAQADAGPGRAAKSISPASAPQPAPPQWADSLRQTALRMLSQCPAAGRPGLSQLQALLLEACLAHVASGRRMPDSHSGWQTLWQSAWQAWQGEDAPSQPSGAAATTAPTTAPVAAQASASVAKGAAKKNATSPPVPAPPPQTAPQGKRPRNSTDTILQDLAQRLQHQRWGWCERLRLARLLETRPACERWLQLFDEPQRWRFLQAQFGPAAQSLRQRSTRLLQVLSHKLQAPMRALQSHWQTLCKALFIDGLGADRAMLRKHQALLLAEAGATGTAPPPASSPTFAPRRQRQDKAGTNSQESEVIWVRDGGQVLLAVYAERLFGHLGLTQARQFVDEAARARAVLCLQALVHGPGQSEEPDWVLSKLLCGAAPGSLLPLCEPVDPAQEELLDGLLGSVIEHWKALGKTSVQGLRDSFLLREARLQRLKPAEGDEANPSVGTGQAWRLSVEPRAYDMLLDRLPWSFSLIKLPWMGGALHVDWR